MKKTYNIYKTIIYTAITLLSIVACSEENPYLEYTTKSSIKYSGAAEPVSTHSGNERIKISVKLSNDPTVKILTIRWLELGVEKSKDVQISMEDVGTTIDVLIENIPEGVYSFTLSTASEDRQIYSVKTEITGEVFGETKTNILPIQIAGGTFDEEEVISLIWNERVDPLLVGNDVKYINDSDEEVILNLAKEELELNIEDHKFDTPIVYYTKYFSEVWLDTLYTKEKLVDLTFKSSIVEIPGSNINTAIVFPTDYDYDRNFASWAGGKGNLFDGSTGRIMAGVDNSEAEQLHVAFEFETDVSLHYFKIWQRLTSNDMYNTISPKIFELWGSNEPSEDGSFNSWTRMGQFEIIKPSGNPIGDNTQADLDAASAGYEFEIPIGSRNFKYVRLKIIETWAGPPNLMIAELRFWGK
tara:strand:- start:7735 stop:8973 length:1239 start_codon:yes stop_codon:yes gene_type:complete